MLRRRLITLFSIVSPLLLLLFSCVIAFMLTGLAAWWLLDKESSDKIIQITTIGPWVASSPTPHSPQPPISSQDPVVPENSAPSPSLTPTPVPTQATEDIVDAIEDEDIVFPEGAITTVNLEGLGNRVHIPKINLTAAIVFAPLENRTWNVSHLKQEIGHLEGTAAVGSDSNLVLAAHVTLNTGVYGPFAHLSQLTAGDVVYVYQDGIPHEYIIDGQQVVGASQVSVTNPSSSGKITLITCSNWDAATGEYIERLIVTGSLNKG